MFRPTTTITVLPHISTPGDTDNGDKKKDRTQTGSVLIQKESQADGLEGSKSVFGHIQIDYKKSGQ